MKKILFFIGLMVYGTIVFGQATATLRAGSTDLTGITPGTKIYLPVIVDAKSDNVVTGYQFFIDYDHDVLSWDGSITNPLPGVSYFHPNFPYAASDYLFNDNGTAIIVTYVDPSWNGKIILPSEIFITFKFTYLGGETDLIWENWNDNSGSQAPKYFTELYDENFENYTLTLVNGCVCLPNFDVTFHVTDGGNDLEGADVTIDSQTITTDINGNAVFNLADGDYSYTVTKTGYYDAGGDITVAGANQIVEVPMSLFGTEFPVTFQVTSGGNPLQNAKVMAGGKTAFTNSFGEAVLNLANGDFTYNVSKYGYTTQTGPFTVAGSPLTIPVDLPMLPHYDIVFHVTSGGADVGGALINIPGVGSNLTDASGMATFSMVDGNYNYTVSKTGYANSTAPFTVAGATQNINVSLAQLYNITFHVTDGTTNLAGAQVTVGSVTKVTNASGNTVFSLPDGDYTYLVTKLDYNDETGPFTVAGAIQTIDITMSLITFPVTFHVTSEGNDIAGALITIGTDTELTDANGIAVFDLPSGSYFYTITKLGYYDEAGNFDVLGAPTAVDVSLSPFFFDVVFHVTNATGGNLSGAAVTVGTQTVTTNTLGNALFNLPNGDYDYEISKAGYDTETGTVTVNNANITENVTLYLTVWDITFHVTDDEGVDLEGASVAIGSEVILTDVNGIAVFSRPDGTYNYLITKLNYGTQSGSFTVAGASPPTIEIVMPYLTYEVKFHIVSTGGGLPGVTVTCGGEVEITDANGDAFFYFPNGTYPYTAVLVGYVSPAPGNIVVNGVAQIKNLIMFPETWDVTFVVTNNGNPISGATVTMDGETETTGTNGTAVFEKSNGTYTYTVEHPSYGTVDGDVTVFNANITEPVMLVGVSDITSGSFNIYPNPSTGIFNLTTNTTLGNGSDITVYNTEGKQVYSGKLEGNEVEVIDLSNQDKGMYLLKILVDDKVFNKTLINK